MTSLCLCGEPESAHADDIPRGCAKSGCPMFVVAHHSDPPPVSLEAVEGDIGALAKIGVGFE